MGKTVKTLPILATLSIGFVSRDESRSWNSDKQAEKRYTKNSRENKLRANRHLRA